MSKEVVFTMKIDAELHEALVAEAKAGAQPVERLVQASIREFLDRQRESHEYDAFLAKKIARAHEDIAVGRFYTSEEVEARFAERRAALLARATASGQ